MKIFRLIVSISAVFHCIFAQSQNEWVLNPIRENNYPSTSQLESDVEFLCDSLLQGRSRGCKGHSDAAFFIQRRFRAAGLRPFNGTFVKSFPIGKNSAGHNIIGLMFGGNRTEDKYIVVGAHYDNLGIINGILYPGADSNASGVAALLEIASTFNKQRLSNCRYNCNIIFVAFDGYIDGRLGSKAFIEAVEKGRLMNPFTFRVIRKEDIKAMVDMDQIGSSLAPPDIFRSEYLIAIGESSLPQQYEGTLERCNKLYGCNLNLYDNYYGSKRFTQAFYTLGDRKYFIRSGIPTIYFTSGITKNNNTPDDKASALDYGLLRKRSILIFRFIEKLL